MFGDWKVDVVYRPEYLGYVVYMSRKMPNGQEFITKDGKTEVLKPGDFIKSDKQYCFAILDPDQVQRLADAFANKGIHTVNDNVNKGKLEATEKHLEDMRNIVFKGKHV